MFPLCQNGLYHRESSAIDGYERVSLCNTGGELEENDQVSADSTGEKTDGIVLVVLCLVRFVKMRNQRVAAEYTGCACQWKAGTAKFIFGSGR